MWNNKVNIFYEHERFNNYSWGIYDLICEVLKINATYNNMKNVQKASSDSHNVILVGWIMACQRYSSPKT